MSVNLSVEEARQILLSYSCTEPKTVESEVEKERLQRAVALITQLSEAENLGICADNTEQGLTVLLSYLHALDYVFKLDREALPIVETPVYIKFNGQRQTCSLDSYTGSYRGVLISCQSEDERISGTYGHFPLDLFD